MKQSKKGSICESLTNLVVGYSINVVANFLIFPHFGWELTASDNIKLGLFYTGISLVRSYTLRRIYNKYNFFGAGGAAGLRSRLRRIYNKCIFLDK